MQSGEMMLSEAQIHAVIASIPDPEIPVITISELGILRSVKTSGNKCLVTLTPTYIGCPAMDMLQDEIRERLTGIGVRSVEVDIVYAPAWSSSWLSDSTLTKLRDYGIAAPAEQTCSMPFTVQCPVCHSLDTRLISRFSSTACKALHKCDACGEPFESFKCH
jgi:ring-1,2-phenylacetyl-CoA epoxidase subunit PaaD